MVAVDTPQQRKIANFVKRIKGVPFCVIALEDDSIDTCVTNLTGARDSAIDSAKRNPDDAFSIVKLQETVALKKVIEVT